MTEKATHKKDKEKKRQSLIEDQKHKKKAIYEALAARLALENKDYFPTITYPIHWSYEKTTETKK